MGISRLNLIVAATAGILAGHVALASTTTCSNSDGTLRYVATRPDGGATAPSSAHVFVRGAEVLDATVQAKPRTRTDISSKTFAEHRTTVYVEYLRFLTASGPELGTYGSDFMICTHQQYVGPPKP